jgi:RNA polymerase sigma factor (sigma-70 family)
VAIGRDRDVRRQIRTLCDAGAIGGLTDGQLLERFATGGGEAAEAAFALLVERHGPMVLRVCLGVLADPHAAEDAFQAAFLVLVKKARGLWVRDCLGPWLHQVALRTALCARSRAALRRKHERRAAESAPVGREGGPMGGDLEGMLHREIGRLPERYRAPVVLCDLEGRTHEQAARHLGLPVGTVKSRLTRARQRLRRRLTRLGLAPTAGLGASFAEATVQAVPAELARDTILNMTRFAAGRASAGAVPAAVAALAGETLRTMMRSQIQILTAMLVAATVATGAAIAASGMRGAGPLPASRPASSQDDPVPPVADGDADAEADSPFRPVKRGKLSLKTAGRGTLEPTKAPDVISEVAGVTTILSLIPEGTRVKKGDLVAELDSSTLRDNQVNQEIALKRVEAEYENAVRSREVAQIALKEYEEGLLPQEQAALRGEVAAAEEMIRKASSRLERTRKAAQQLSEMMAARGGDKSASDIVAELDIGDRQDDAEAAIGSGKRALQLARHKLEALEEFARPKMMTQLKIAIERAKEEELGKHQARDLEKSKLDHLKRQISKCKLIAPSDGMIVYATSPRPATGRPNERATSVIEEGANVRERQVILSVVDLDGPMRVNAKIPEAFVDRVAKGMRARIAVDAFPNRVLAGVVEAVAPVPDPTTSFDRMKLYTTQILIEGGGQDLRPGMSAGVEITTQEVDDVISIPIQAVLVRRGKSRVAVKRADGGFDWRDVTLGVADESRVEVKAGLEVGESVAINPRVLQDMEALRRYDPAPKTAPPDKPGR